MTLGVLVRKKKKKKPLHDPGKISLAPIFPLGRITGDMKTPKKVLGRILVQIMHEKFCFGGIRHAVEYFFAQGRLFFIVGFCSMPSEVYQSIPSTVAFLRLS